MHHFWKAEEIKVGRVKSLVKHDLAATSDPFEEMVEELFKIRNPRIRPASPDYATALSSFRTQYTDEGRWFYYPWRQAIAHVLSEADYREVRTARNHDVITVEEQAKIAQAKVGIAGLSVGSSALEALALSGHFKEIRIADFDTLELSNLNRISGSVTDYGLPKWVGAARKVYELDPYANVTIFDEGVTADTIADFMEGLTVVVDAIDTLSMKVMLREQARSSGVAVLMATDIENPVLDVERFDLDQKLPLFHGMMTKRELEEIKAGSGMNLALALRIIGLENMNEGLLRSIPKIGRELASHPQLGASARMAGSVVAHAAIRVITGQAVVSGRAVVPVMSQLDPGYDSPEQTEARTKMRVAIEQALAPAERSSHA
jgi:molybdopterin/thiamine biosynthesis adenylyltransferase